MRQIFPYLNLTQAAIISKQVVEPIDHATKKGSTFINPFVPNAPFLYPLKTSEKCKVFWRFQGVRERVHWEKISLEPSARNGQKTKC